MRNVGAVVLAAGGSTRLGQPKQLLRLQGEILVRRAVCAALEGGCAPCTVVVGDESGRIAGGLLQTSAVITANPDWRQGIGTSIRTGVRELIAKNDALAAVVLLACDQVFVDGRLVSKLIIQWETSGKSIVASRYANTLGIPALFGRSCFDALLALPDNAGAKGLLESRGNDVAEVEFEAGLIDIDTIADYEDAKSRLDPEELS